MSLKRSELREKIMIILYQIEILKKYSANYDVNQVIKDNVKIDNDFVSEIVYGVTTHIKDLDEIANKYMQNWNIERIDKTGASILRMGLYELLFTDTPDVVVINESVELAKKYSDDSVRKIINAVLDKVLNDKEDGK